MLAPSSARALRLLCVCVLDVRRADDGGGNARGRPRQRTTRRPCLRAQGRSGPNCTDEPAHMQSSTCFLPRTVATATATVGGVMIDEGLVLLARRRLFIEGGEQWAAASSAAASNFRCNPPTATSRSPQVTLRLRSLARGSRRRHHAPRRHFRRRRSAIVRQNSQ